MESIFQAGPESAASEYNEAAMEAEREALDEAYSDAIELAEAYGLSAESLSGAYPEYDGWRGEYAEVYRR